MIQMTFLLFKKKNYQRTIFLKFQKWQVNVSAAYGGRLQCHKFKDYIKISKNDQNLCKLSALITYLITCELK